jgi:predicted transcriptional regulator
VGKVPALVRTIIRNQIRRGSPYMPVWLDFEDQLRASYPFQTGVPNVLIVDTQGRLRYTASGAMGPEQVGQMTRAIQELRQEAVSAK